MHRQEDDLCFSVHPHQVVSRVDPIHDGHGNVYQKNIRTLSHHFIQCGSTIGRSAYNFVGGVQEVVKLAQNCRIVVSKEKQSIVDQSMGLDAAKKSQFWAIYSDYQTALDVIWDKRIANINKYADNIDKMTDEIADQLAVTMMDLEGQRAALRNKYYKLYKEKMGARMAARFLQVECSLAFLIDLQLAVEIIILP